MDRGRIIASLLGVVLVVGGCIAGGAPSPTPTPPAAPVVTQAPTATAAPTETPSALEPITVDSIAVVVTNDLLVRSKPGTGAGSKKLSPLLNAGQEVYVVAGPVAASGYQWYEVDPTMGAGTSVTPAVDPPAGWVATASTEGVPWLLPKRGVCRAPGSESGRMEVPTEFFELADLEPAVGLVCLGDRPMTFEATLGSYETCGLRVWTIEPEWLGDPCFGNDLMWLGDPGAEDYAYLNGQIVASFAPGVDTSRLHPGPEAKDWVKVKVTGQFDHPAARSCHGVAGEEKVPLTQDPIVLACRMQFVITAITVVR